jgi:pimeloyl-ACP methyl ester carboxylesterase
MIRLVRALAGAIPTASTRQIDGAGHAAPFDATDNFVQVVAEAVEERHSPNISPPLRCKL